jgi:hypothetical protein
MVESSELSPECSRGFDLGFYKATLFKVGAAYDMYAQNPNIPVEKLPPLFYDAVIHACRQTGAPPEVVVSDTFALTSTHTQRLFKVKGFNGSVMPLTLNTLSLAPTAIGKGESYRMFFQQRNELEISELTQPAGALTIEDLLLQDVTPSALMSKLAGHGKSASIQLEDGYSFLYSLLMKRNFISKLPQVWSGPPSLKLVQHRGNYDAFEPCVEIGLRIQADLFYLFLMTDKSVSRHLGLWPRFLTFCYDPQQFPVTPWYAEAGPSMASSIPLMERLGVFRCAAPDSNEPAREVLVMDTYANAYLREIAYWVKGQMNGEFHDIQDAAGRAAENTLRLASNFHVVCQGYGPISREMIERAWAFVYWSLCQFRNVFVLSIQSPPKPARLKEPKRPKLPSHHRRLQADTQFLIECIGARSGHFVYGKVPLAEAILLTGYSKARFLRALYWLATAGYIETEGDEARGTIRLLPLAQANFPFGYMQLGGQNLG